MGNQSSASASNKQTIFDFSVPGVQEGTDVNLGSFRGKNAYLIINVASQ